MLMITIFGVIFKHTARDYPPHRYFEFKRLDCMESKLISFKKAAGLGFTMGCYYIVES